MESRHSKYTRLLSFLNFLSVSHILSYQIQQRGKNLTAYFWESKKNRVRSFNVFWLWSNTLKSFLSCGKHEGKGERKDLEKVYTPAHFYSCEHFPTCRSWNIDIWFISGKGTNTFCWGQLSSRDAETHAGLRATG